MEMYLQLGSGMMQMTRDLIGDWGGGTAILSPRDFDPKQLVTLANDVTELNGCVLFDPQFYLPYSEHKRLCSHQYWPKEYESGAFWSGGNLSTLVEEILALNAELKTSATLLPGLFGSAIDDDWLARQSTLIKAARASAPDTVLYATLALSAEVLRSEDAVHDVLEAFTEWEVDGAYLVCEHPNGDYLVADTMWISNVIDLTAGVKVKKRNAILGYSQHQMMIAACANADAIASGTWMNVRSFPPEKFNKAYEDERRSPTEWFYAPRVFSEYKIGALDTAYKVGLMDHLTIPEGVACSHVDALLSGVQPSAIGLDRPTSFKHYLACLHSQVEQSRQTSFATTVERYARLLDDAETRLAELHAKRIRGQNRDFNETIDSQRQALTILEQVRGPMLERTWND